MAILKSLGLDKPEYRAWALYDWANSAFVCTIVAAILPIYFADVAAATLEQHLRTAYWGYASGFALMIVVILAPVLGALADHLRGKKKFLAMFMLLGVVSSVGLYWVERGDWILACVLFVFGQIGFFLGNVFYESLLPGIANTDDIDRVSTSAYAIGYFGGGVLLAINAFWIMKPALFGFENAGVAVRWSFVSVGVWWLLFSMPLLLKVPEPGGVGDPVSGEPSGLFASFRRLKETFGQIRKFKHALLLLLAYWLYNDGIGTIFKMATIYGREVGVASDQLIGALLLVQFLGVPFTFLFGPLAARLGPKRGIILCLVIYSIICCFAYQMTTALHFWILAGAVAMVQGGSQALTRSLYASMIPRQRAAEFFSFFSVSGKMAGVFGPLIFGAFSHLTGSSRNSILVLIAFFVLGIMMLAKVDVEAGRKAAREAEV